MIAREVRFPRYPRLRHTILSARYGYVELLTVDETSDGFLMGWATIGEGDDAYQHSVFLGYAKDFQERVIS